jgi:hypothetical protein
MYFGMKSNDITKDRLEYYASHRSMPAELIVTDGMEDGASCPTFPRSGGLDSNWALIVGSRHGASFSRRSLRAQLRKMKSNQLGPFTSITSCLVFCNIL